MEKMYVHLGFHLKSLKIIENRKPPEERRDVPTIGELAMAIGVNPDRIYRLTHGRTRSLNLDIAAGIIKEMCKRGFDTDITDILKFEKPEDFKYSSGSAPPPLTRSQRRKYPGDEFVKAYAESKSTAEEAKEL